MTSFNKQFIVLCLTVTRSKVTQCSWCTGTHDEHSPLASGQCVNKHHVASNNNNNNNNNAIYIAKIRAQCKLELESSPVSAYVTGPFRCLSMLCLTVELAKWLNIQFTRYFNICTWLVYNLSDTILWLHLSKPGMIIHLSSFAKIY